MIMKTKFSRALLCGLPIFAALFTSCGLEEPFGTGEGELHIRMKINSEVTRAENDEVDLSSTLKLYLSKGDDLYYKFSGLAEVPDAIPFKSGKYLAEAYAGVSSPASFTDKYYTGSAPFEITSGVTNLTLECKIANVVASVNSATVDPELIKDYTITIGHSEASLTFDDDKVQSEAKGYFIMPAGDNVLTYTVEGDNADGRHFVKSGVIRDVQAAHEYTLNLNYNPDFDSQGGAYLDITIDDTELLIESEVTLTAAPEISGFGFDMTKQVVAYPGAFIEQTVRVRSFGPLEELHVIGLHEWIGDNNIDDSVDLISASESIYDLLAENGISVTSSTNPNNPAIERYFITFSADLLNSLRQKSSEYTMEFVATDRKGKISHEVFRVANSDAAIVYDDPVVAFQIDQNANLMAVGARSATLTGSIIDSDAKSPGMRFREAGTEEWQIVLAPAAASKARKTRASQNFSVKLSNLKPGTRYEYQAYADNFTASDSFFFTTEQLFAIPNASFEEWDTYRASTLLGSRNVVFPGSVERTFWDSGNEGAATANKVLTDKSTEMIHSGTYSCRLASSSALGVMAAGNLFAGSYVKTDGTNGVLQFGRPYNSSHPSKLKVWANYRPGIVDIVKDSSLGMNSGDTDKGQIYVALTTAPVDIRTNPNNRALFDRNSADVIAYGQVTWTEAFGPDGSLEAVEIPITYKNSATTKKPLYIVIVCSASFYGDYFTGSSSSVMYVDDFELIYE